MLNKIGSTLKILKTASSATDVLVDEPLTEKTPGTKIIEPKHSDFLYYRARAISAGDQGPIGKDGSRGWNYNGNFDFFSRKELEASYSSFISRNIFLDHNSESSLYSIGKIIDAVPVDDPETGEFYIELVGKIDRTLHPEICRKIETGELNSTSMGCSVDESKCSICAHVLHSDADTKCDHLSSFGLGKKFEAEIDMPEYNIHKGEMVPAFSINSGIVFNEDSIVGVPADPSAVIKTVLSNMKSRLSKKASLSKEEQLDLAAQMEKLFAKLDESTKISLKAEFCGICPPVNKEAATYKWQCDKCGKGFNELGKKTEPAEYPGGKAWTFDASPCCGAGYDGYEETSKESSMADKNVTPNDEQKKILSKISALEMEQLESYVFHKTKKANDVVNKEVVADATKKEENFLQKVIARVKNSFAAELLEKKIETVAKEEMGKEASDGCIACGKKTGEGYEELCAKCKKEQKIPSSTKASISAKFQEDKNNVLDSTWSVNDGDTCVLEASLKDIWGSTFETLSFDDQKWATSEAYGTEVVARYDKEGLEKLADLWDVTHKLSKTAKGPELGPDGSYAKPTTGLSNKKHDYPTDPKFTKPGQESAQKGPAAPAGTDAKTDPKFKMPGQEEGQKGPSAPKAKEVKTDYSEPKPEAEGKEVTTTPKNPDEKDAKKSEKEVKTDYVAAGTEAMEAEDKGKEKKEAAKKCDNPKCDRSKGEEGLCKPCLEKEKDRDMFKDHPDYKRSSLISWTSLTPKAQEFIKTASKKYIESGMKNAEAVAKAHSEFTTAQETDMKKQAADKPAESVEGSTLPEGTKKFDAKPDESVKGTTLPEEGKSAASPETSVEGDKEHKTPNLTKAPDQSVDGTTLPPQGKKDEESVEKTTHPDSKKSMGDESDKSVNKSAATEMPPLPEHADPLVDDVKPEEKPLDLPMDGPKVDAPKEELSAFDTAETLDIGEGYSAHKDKESKEIIVEKDGKEVKRLPDGFGKEVSLVLPLMKAVLGLPAEEAKEEVPGMAAPKMEEPKIEEHPAVEEAHEDELGIKESSLKAKEVELNKKEAELKAKEDAAAKEEATKKFASVLQTRSERCRKIVAELIDKEQLSYDKTVYESELKNGAHLLDARKKAFEASITAKMKEFIALNDEGLSVVEATVKSIQAPASNTNTKKASRIFVSPQYNEQMTEEQELAKIFGTMGTKNRPQ